jgi:phage FluMu protein Com
LGITMTQGEDRTECAACGQRLAQARTEAEAALPCPACGSYERNLFASMAEAVVLRDGFSMKTKRVGQKKPFVESISVPSHSRKLGKLVQHDRLIDRDNDLYYEKVTEYESGNTLHEHKEPLSEHVGHGSDKKKFKTQ